METFSHVYSLLFSPPSTVFYVSYLPFILNAQLFRWPQHFTVSLACPQVTSFPAVSSINMAPRGVGARGGPESGPGGRGTSSRGGGEQRRSGRGRRGQGRGSRGHGRRRGDRRGQSQGRCGGPRNGADNGEGGGAILQPVPTLTNPRDTRLHSDQHDEDRRYLADITIIPTEGEVRSDRPGFLP